MSNDAILDDWIAYLTASGYTTKTIRESIINIQACLRRTGKTTLTMTRQDLIEQQGRDGLKPASRSRYKSLYHSYWTWVQDEGYRLDNPAARLPRVRVPQQEANPVTTGDLEHLLASGIYAKTRMYVLLYAYQGFRCVEIAAVSGQSVDWDRRRILSVDGKGGKVVWRPMHPIVWEEAQKYPRQGLWFPGKKGHVTANNVSNVLGKAIRRAGIVGHRPHNLRAWYATELSEAGTPTAVIAAALRHSDLQSIPRYVSIREEAIREAHARLPVVVVPDRSGRRLAA